MKFENVLEDINGFGRFQKMMIVINFIGRFSMPCHFMLNNFIAVVPSHHCDLTALDMGGAAFTNITPEQKLIIGVPMQEDGTPSSCQMYEEPQYHLLLGDSNGTQPQAVPCQSGWVFDNSTFKSTLATEVRHVSLKRHNNRLLLEMYLNTDFKVGFTIRCQCFRGVLVP